MPSYVILINWTDQGIKGVKETLTRAEQAEAMMNSMGVSLKSLHWTSGRYDLVAIAEASDDMAASAAALKLGSVGAVRSETLRAFDRAEMAEIVNRMG